MQAEELMAGGKVGKAFFFLQQALACLLDKGPSAEQYGSIGLQIGIVLEQ